MSQIGAVSTNYKQVSTDVVSNVFATMLEMDASPDGPRSRDAHYPIVGTVYFAGGWKGAILIEFEESLAFDITARLLNIARPLHIDGDVRDAVGEVVSMIAGNLKPIMPPDTHMSMPSVVQGGDFKVSVVGSNQHDRMMFRSGNKAFSLTLVHVHD
ncbi:MAG: chemotaxis protein CheX [Acidobacteria bacterium]|nr:chemotaxis protein CheX [Acidobacteriota bacterium]